MATDSTARKMALSQSGGGSYTLPKASTTVLGGVKVDGDTITIDGNGVISSTGGGYEPDTTTITLNGSSQLQVADSLLDTINSVGTDITVADATTITQVLQPNKLYNIDASTLCTTLTLSLATPITDILSHYYVMVKCGTTPPTLTEISGVNTITLTANKTTEISILKGHAFFSAY